MTRPSLAGIEKRAAAATEGPWDMLGGGEYVSGPDIVVAPDDGGVTPADAAFIADARTAVPALAAAVRGVLAIHIAEKPRSDPDFHHTDRVCIECGDPFPCRTYIALANRLDLTDPEGDPR